MVSFRINNKSGNNEAYSKYSNFIETGPQSKGPVSTHGVFCSVLDAVAKIYSKFTFGDSASADFRPSAIF